jgi:hypothetical protein
MTKSVQAVVSAYDRLAHARRTYMQSPTAGTMFLAFGGDNLDEEGRGRYCLAGCIARAYGFRGWRARWIGPEHVLAMPEMMLVAEVIGGKFRGDTGISWEQSISKRHLPRANVVWGMIVAFNDTQPRRADGRVVPDAVLEVLGEAMVLAKKRGLTVAAPPAKRVAELLACTDKQSKAAADLYVKAQAVESSQVKVPLAMLKTAHAAEAFKAPFIKAPFLGVSIPLEQLQLAYEPFEPKKASTEGLVPA